jgi:hypothetical protein
MFNQIKRIWSDNGSGDKDFTPQEEKLKDALLHLQQAADSLSRASETLLTVIRSHGVSQ